MNYVKFVFFALVILFFLGQTYSTGWCQPTRPDTVRQAQEKLNEKSDSTETNIKSPTGAMLRSLFFPGLGQWYNGKKLKAVVIFLGQTGLLANSIYLNQQLVKSQTDYEREFYINNRNLSVWWLVGVTLFSMADAYVDAQLSDFDESPDLSHIQIQPFVSKNSPGIVFSVCYRF
jgi:hypothetical protein